MYLDFNNISVISIAVHFIEGEKTLYSTYRKTLTLFEPLTNFYHLKLTPHQHGWVWFGLWCLTPLPTIFQLYHGVQFYC